jgi:uncharacterized membrane protein
MARPGASWREKSVPVAAILTLGVGIFAFLLGFEWFWMVFVLGWIVVVPLLAILFDESEVDRALDGSSGSEPEDALETLRDRYARGELDDVEFERRVEKLLENESIEQVEERVEKERERAGR